MRQNECKLIVFASWVAGSKRRWDDESKMRCCCFLYYTETDSRQFLFRPGGQRHNTQKTFLSCLSTVIKNKHKHCPSRLLPSNFKREIGGECFSRAVGGRQCPNLTVPLCFSNKAFKNKQLHWRSHTWRLAFRDSLNTAQGLASTRLPNSLIILSLALCVHRASAYN